MIAVSPSNFRRHMDHVKGKYRVLRFEDEWTDLKEPAVVVTFDDGYADNVLEALPILEEMEVPATFFVSTGLLGTGNEFLWHRLERILLADGEFPLAFELRDPRYGRRWDTSSPEQRRALYDALNRFTQRIDAARREDWLDQLTKWADRGDAERHPEEKSVHRSMSLEELKKLAASPWATIGAHTVTHPLLCALDDEGQREEILTSRETLEEILGRKVETFSYPFGRKCDYDRRSVRLCGEAGFTKAASNFPGQVHRWTDPFQLPRHLVRNWELDVFAAEMKSFWTR
jgi:peptidoglycan/xylan/chitin deacetylase (PgdA/CDA1 family)